MDNGMELNIKKIFDSVCKDSTINDLANISYIKSFKKGSILYLDKDNIECLMVVLNGAVSLYKETPQCDKKVIFILSDNCIINEEVLFYDEVSTGCEVIEDSVVLCFNRKDFLNLMKKDFCLVEFIMKKSLKKNRRMNRQIKNNSTLLKIDKKMASKLWKLANDYGIECEKGIEIQIKLSITYLAKMIGAKRETTSRAIKQLINKGLIIVENNTYIIVDKDELANFFYEE